MAMKSLKKINANLQLYRKKFLNQKLYILLCNSLIQPHFDYACVFSYPLVIKKMRKKTHAAENKCMFLLKAYIKASYKS